MSPYQTFKKLFIAIENHDNLSASILLTNLKEDDAINRFHQHDTPLSKAVSAGNADMLDVLIEQGAKFDVVASRILVHLALEEDHDMTEKLENLGFDLKSRSMSYSFVKECDVIDIEFLLQMGLDPSHKISLPEQPQKYTTALHIAVQHNSHIAATLLYYDASPNHTDSEGHTVYDVVTDPKMDITLK